MAKKTLTLPLTVVTCTLLAPATTTAQGTPFKREIDGLVRYFRDAARKDHSLADGSCRQTAMVLAAMGHCHRFYALQDGPAVRNPANFLFSRRQKDGSFQDRGGDAVATTLWVVDALSALEPDAFAQEIAKAKDWLKSRTKKESAFADVTVSEQELPGLLGSVARGPIMRDGKVNVDATVHALVKLVKAQAGMRENDAATPEAPRWTPTQQKGVDFLLTKQDAGKFFMLQPVAKDKVIKIHDLGLTGMGIASLQTKPEALRSAAEKAAIDAGLAWIASSQNANGSFGESNRNYTTSAAIFALSKAGRREFEPLLKKAQKYIIGIQNTEGGGYRPDDRDYGSFGYGGDVRGDLSNTQFAVDALRKTNIDPKDESLAKAIVFLQRTQNLRASNDFEAKTRDSKGRWHRTASGNDGGSAYYPGNSPAGYIELPDGTKIPRSYGSMTYALLKTYTLCGVEPDDPRIQAAVGWIQKNWNLDTNPGADPKLPEKYRYQGLFYYYMVMAQALHAARLDTLTVDVQNGDAQATQKIDWRKVLGVKLRELQKSHGGWVNDKNGRWWEASDLVCSTYAMLALEHCR